MRSPSRNGCSVALGSRQAVALVSGEHQEVGTDARSPWDRDRGQHDRRSPRMPRRNGCSVALGSRQGRGRDDERDQLQVGTDARSPWDRDRELVASPRARRLMSRNGCSVALGSRRERPRGHTPGTRGRNGCSVALGSRHALLPFRGRRLTSERMLGRLGIETPSPTWRPVARSERMLGRLGIETGRAAHNAAFTRASERMLGRLGIETLRTSSAAWSNSMSSERMLGRLGIETDRRVGR